MDLRDVRVIIATNDGPVSRRLKDFLLDNGMVVNVTEDPSQLKKLLLEWNPKFLIVDFMFPNWNAIAIMKFMKECGTLREDGCRVFVVSAHNHKKNVDECLKSGASDYIVRPFKTAEILSRIVLHTQKRTEIKEENFDTNEQEQYYLHLVDLALKECQQSENLNKSLFNLTNMVALTLKAVRVSIVQCDTHQQKGIVRASSDDPDLNDLNINIANYHEINYVIYENKMLAIDNMNNDPKMREVLSKVQSIKFNAMVVCPIHTGKGEIFGVLSARLPDNVDRLTDFHLRFAQITARIAGTLLKAWGVSASNGNYWPIEETKKAS